MFGRKTQGTGVCLTCGGQSDRWHRFPTIRLATAIAVLSFAAVPIGAAEDPEGVGDSRPVPVDRPADSAAGRLAPGDEPVEVPAFLGIETLVQLRRMLGNPFAGTCFESELVSDREFGRQLQRAARQRGSCSVHKGGPSRTNGRDIPGSGASGIGEAFSSPNYRESMRHVARQLDQLAADLEDLDRYGDADELRHVAARLRQSVRCADLAAETCAAEAAASALRHALRRE